MTSFCVFENEMECRPWLLLSLQSHYTFMAGLSFLYAFSNLNKMDGASGAPTLEDAMIDIESSLAILEYLSGELFYWSFRTVGLCLTPSNRASPISFSLSGLYAIDLEDRYRRVQETERDARRPAVRAIPALSWWLASRNAH